MPTAARNLSFDNSHFSSAGKVLGRAASFIKENTGAPKRSTAPLDGINLHSSYTKRRAVFERSVSSVQYVPGYLYGSRGGIWPLSGACCSRSRLPCELRLSESARLRSSCRYSPG